eukprot:CAMPEP_0198251906 /NCGR_PEP_ID=MMETSP1447-20131203/2582_1 /TAXON_ID=420782 /ORGANISM="Chaetoceros dichaeta, Strain CCMP1751" /LENGTH=192 /DNA_ID=CAMNT_0043937029 /DNA_START=158 /DNA_END=733 /DNA_ORIENTATION=-
MLQISSEFDEQCNATVTPTDNTISDFPGERRTLTWADRSELAPSDLAMHTITMENRQLPPSRPPLHGESTRASTGTTESDENELPHNAEKMKKEYVLPLPPDIIIDCLGRRHGANIGVRGYVEALYADRYEEAETRLERALIVCTVLDSIKVRGGKFLKESSSKRGMYYEVDEFYSMKKIEDALDQSNKMAK